MVIQYKTAVVKFIIAIIWIPLLVNIYFCTRKTSYKFTSLHNSIFIRRFVNWIKGKRWIYTGLCRNSSNFSNPIKRQKIKNFASEAGRFKVSSSTEKKLVTVTLTRDLFESILFRALQSKVDMEEVLKYPLTPVPLSLCHPDGFMQKTSKSKLLLELEKRIVTRSPRTIHVRIIYGMFFLHLLVELPNTFSTLSTFILKQVCRQNGIEIHLVQYLIRLLAL